MQLLLVEDDDRIAKPLVQALEREGFDVAWVATGAEAIAFEGADLVLLDLGLPDVDGFDVCRAIRARAATPVI